jgi:hypothetical protein
LLRGPPVLDTLVWIFTSLCLLMMNFGPCRVAYELNFILGFCHYVVRVPGDLLRFFFLKERTCLGLVW